MADYFKVVVFVNAFTMDFAVRVTLIRHIKTDSDCNYNVCTKRI